MALMMAAAKYTSNSMLGNKNDPEPDGYPNKSEIRHRFRRPLNELINEIGEGRGIFLTKNLRNEGPY